MGWVVQVADKSAEPVQPISVEPEPDISHLLAELQRDLDAMVAGQQQQYNAYGTEMAGMSENERALIYSEHAGGAVYMTAPSAIPWTLSAPPSKHSRSFTKAIFAKPFRIRLDNCLSTANSLGWSWIQIIVHHPLV
jgi:hypothetical protein